MSEKETSMTYRDKPELGSGEFRACIIQLSEFDRERLVEYGFIVEKYESSTLFVSLPKKKPCVPDLVVAAQFSFWQRIKKWLTREWYGK